MPYPIGFRPDSLAQLYAQNMSNQKISFGNFAPNVRAGSSPVYNSMARQTPQTPQSSPIRQSSVMDALKTIYAYSSAIAEKRQQDQASGIGLFQGARVAVQDSEELRNQMEAADTLRAYQQLMTAAYANKNYASKKPSVLPPILEKLGSKAQSEIYKQLLGETQKEIGNLIGYDPQKLVQEIVPPELQEALGIGQSTAGQVASGAAGAAEASGAAGAQAGSVLGKVTGFAGAAYSVYNLVKDWGDMPPVAGAVNGFTAGAYVGSYFGPVGTVVGGALGAIAGAVNGLFGGGKSKAQLARDGIRDMLQKAGIVDSNWCLKLADGSSYDIGKDGGAKLQNLDGNQRHAYDIDLNDPRAGQAIGWVQPLVTLITGGDPKLTADFTGYFVNAALSNAKDWEGVKANIQGFYAQVGLEPEKLVMALAQMSQQGALDGSKLEAYANGVQSLFDPNYAPIEFAGGAPAVGASSAMPILDPESASQAEGDAKAQELFPERAKQAA